MSLKRLLIYVIAFILLSACTGSTPSEADARQMFEKEYRHYINNGNFKILSFKKIDGQSGEAYGVKFYKMNYQAQVEFLKKTPCLNFSTQSNCVNQGWNVQVGHQVGDKIPASGEVTFQKTENGWRAEHLKAYH